MVIGLVKQLKFLVLDEADKKIGLHNGRIELPTYAVLKRRHNQLDQLCLMNEFTIKIEVLLRL